MKKIQNSYIMLKNARSFLCSASLQSCLHKSWHVSKIGTNKNAHPVLQIPAEEVFWVDFLKSNYLLTSCLEAYSYCSVSFKQKNTLYVYRERGWFGPQNFHVVLGSSTGGS